MEGTGVHHTKQNKRASERKMLLIFSPVWNQNLKRKRHAYDREWGTNWGTSYMGGERRGLMGDNMIEVLLSLV
jgi:hypothetical protein